jgi:hypothetical protein
MCKQSEQLWFIEWPMQPVEVSDTPAAISSIKFMHIVLNEKNFMPFFTDFTDSISSC